jgi:hypothetical protein
MPSVGPPPTLEGDPESVFVEALPPVPAAAELPVEGLAIDVSKGPKKTGFRVQKKAAPKSPLKSKPDAPPAQATQADAAPPSEEKKKSGWKFW